MKIIDLLNKIANGEEVPKKIKVHDTEYHKCILKAGIDYKIYSDDFYYLSDDICKAGFSLNDEVEILEEEKKTPDEININLAYIDKEYLLDKEDVDRKINEIINRHNILVDKVSDYLKSKGDE